VNLTNLANGQLNSAQHPCKLYLAQTTHLVETEFLILPKPNCILYIYPPISSIWHILPLMMFFWPKLYQSVLMDANLYIIPS
jgi:hypothetical protein